MNNSIFSIRPYRYSGMWVFDDDRVGLVKEPFVEGMPEIIDYILAQKGLPQTSFNLLFSATELPNPDAVLIKDEPFAGGTWYEHQKTDMRGWLCPALFLYFKNAPERLYLKIS